MVIISVIVFVLLVVILVGYWVSIYNSFVMLKNNIDKAWSNIDLLLQQRHDELTKLLESVKGYMNFEKDVLTQITQARTAFMGANSVADKANADNMMTGALKSVFAVAENYPQLKASENFIQFQNRISEIETQVRDRREFYNDSVNMYNTRLEQIPYVFIAQTLNYTRKDLFKVDEESKKDVDVKF